MKVDIQQLEQLSDVFLQVIGQIFVSPPSNETFNEMTGAQKKILFALNMHGPQKMSEIARQVAVTMSGATGIVDKMVKAGLVQREDHPSDRRVTLITLTPLGLRTVKEINRIHEQRLEEVLEKLDPDERAELIAAFERIHELLTAIEAPAGDKGAVRK